MFSVGLVDTEMTADFLKNTNWSALKAEDVSEAVLFALGTPPHVQIHELTIKPIGELF